ncbi:Malic acid transport [Lecanosticta acicola]|uniref:Malic acid transport n=1 Tax=Lecanosticta acicola TaxID=111012 RepID=A0AAI8YZT6_9PEZI|nr:Malic acid transport [Lecanosticta acicola]
MSSSDKEGLDLENGNSSQTENSNGHAVSSQRRQQQQQQQQQQQSKDETEKHTLAFLPWLRQNFTWSWFTAPQSTGGIAALLSLCPKQFPGLQTIGTIIFIFNILLLATFTLFALLRFASHERPVAAFARSLVTPPECYFFGSLLLSSATMIINMQRFALPHVGPWLLPTLRILFWLYAACSLLVVTLQSAFIFHYTPFQAIHFAPPMIITILSAMLTGTIAAALAASQPPPQRLPIMVAGVAYQGLGWLVCTMFLTLCLANCLENGWPAPRLRPGLFVMVGTSGFTIVALIGIARAAPPRYAYFAAHPAAAETLLVLATWAGIFLWLFSFWVFALAAVINLADLFHRDQVSRKWRFNHALTWTNTAWAGIFPNVGWALGTIYLGEELESEGVLWVSVGMIVLLVVFWLLDLVMMGKKVWLSLFVDSRVKIS